MEHLLSNSEAVPLEVQAREEAEMAVAALKARRQAVLDALGSTTVLDDEDLRKAADKVTLAKALRDTADAALQPIGEPYRAATHAVSVVGREFCGMLKDAELAVQRSINAFRDRQREAAARARTEQQERERQLRIEAGLESAEAPAPEPVKASAVRLGTVRSDYRGQVFDRKTVEVRIIDVRALPDTVLKSPGVIEACEKAVRQLEKLTRDIPGAEITDGVASNVKAG